jgi:hypothetical protein
MKSKTIDIKYLLERVQEITEYIENGNRFIEDINQRIDSAENMFSSALLEIQDLNDWIRNPSEWWSGDEDYEEEDWLDDIKDE